jgi:DNA helicase-2/ATP-dependent DNA helicase PcrA
VNLPDLSAPVPIGKELDAARERVSQAQYEKGEELDLGSGAFTAPRPDAVATADATAVEWRAGDRVRHRRFGEGIVVSSRLEKGDEWVTVAFVGQGVKELIAAYAGLERT